MFSIVIPLYNKAHTIQTTLASVLAQTFPDFEVIIINDGSTDGGDLLAKEYADPRIRVIDQPNAGVSAARNNGVKLAMNRHIAFLDGDDEWLPDYLKRVNEMVVQYPDAVMYCSERILKTATETIYQHVHKGKIVKVDYFMAPDIYSHTSATVVKKEVFIEVGGFPSNVKYWEDFTLFTRMGLAGEVIYSGIPLAIYNGDVPGQAVKNTNNLERKINDQIEYLNVFANLFSSHKDNTQFRAWIIRMIRHHIWNRLRAKDFTSLAHLIAKLNEAAKKSLGMELWLYRQPKLHFLSVALLGAIKTLRIARFKLYLQKMR